MRGTLLPLLSRGGSGGAFTLRSLFWGDFVPQTPSGSLTHTHSVDFTRRMPAAVKRA